MMIRRTACSALFALTLAASILPGGAVRAEGTNVAFGGIQSDTTQPVELNADTLSVNQADGSAVFSGNVLVVQGQMRLTADELRVQYKADRSGIETLFATGKVLLVNATDAAQADHAVYTIDSGDVVMTGNVLLTQGPTATSADKLIVNLKTGTGRMEGRVSTTFVPGKK